LGKNITLDFNIKNAAFFANASLDIKIDKKIWGIWTEVPCLDGVGTCHYDSICTFFNPSIGPCKPPFSTNNIPAIVHLIQVLGFSHQQRCQLVILDLIG